MQFDVFSYSKSPCLMMPGKDLVLLAGSFLAPDWYNLHKYIHQPEKFLLYRINGNDPLNSPQRAKNTGNIHNKMSFCITLHRILWGRLET